MSVRELFMTVLSLTTVLSMIVLQVPVMSVRELFDFVTDIGIKEDAVRQQQQQSNTHWGWGHSFVSLAYLHLQCTRMGVHVRTGRRANEPELTAFLVVFDGLRQVDDYLDAIQARVKQRNSEVGGHGSSAHQFAGTPCPASYPSPPCKKAYDKHKVG